MTISNLRLQEKRAAAYARFGSKTSHVQKLAQEDMDIIDELLTLRKEKSERDILTAPPAVPQDFITHENSWRKAFERLIELEPESHDPDSDEKGFWQHELSAFNRAYSELNAYHAAMLAPAPKPGDDNT